MSNSTGDKICLICWENIENYKWTKCLRCNITLHDICEETYRNQKGYCKCPHCQRIGSLGIYTIWTSNLVNNRLRFWRH